MTSNNLPRTLFRAALASWLLAVAAAAPAADWRWNNVDRVVAVSDVHGAWEPMVKTLQSAEILDEALAWEGGPAHLVITGDILDRGPDSRKVMDLLMRLENEATAAGGRVHVLLGNHEVMNLTGDLRYVSAAEYAAFADEETPEDRQQAFRVFRSLRPAVADAEVVQREFDMRAPPGYFAHRRAFSPEGRYGKWLLEKPLIVVIDDTAFVHGGLSPMVAELGLAGLNDELATQVARYVRQLGVVIEAGLLDPTAGFHQHAALLEALPEDGGRPADVAAAIADVIALNNASVHDTESPVWYRGNVGCGALIENDKLDAALSALDARRVVIGHTPTVSRRVLQRLEGRVVEIDTGMLNAAYGGSGSALVVEGDLLAVVREDGSKMPSPVEHPRSAAPDAPALSVAELESLLAEAEVGSVTSGGSKSLVSLKDGDLALSAAFIRNPRSRGFVPELAAYRLDRLLGLDMVPVTVAREIDGVAGVLQLLPANAKNETARSASGDGHGAWCALPEQWNAMYVFDALSHNALRHPDNMLYAPGTWQLMLTGHENAFAAKRGRPAWLKNVELQLNGAWEKTLSSLDDEVLQAELGDVLDKKRLSALAKRRDALLKEAI